MVNKDELKRERRQSKDSAKWCSMKFPKIGDPHLLVYGPTNIYLWNKGAKKPIKTNGKNHHTKNKKEGQRRAKRHVGHKNQKRERSSPSCGKKLSHPPPFNVTRMQIVRFNSNRRSRTNISRQRNLLFYNKG
jgi:hypothetical protein